MCQGPQEMATVPTAQASVSDSGSSSDKHKHDKKHKQGEDVEKDAKGKQNLKTNALQRRIPRLNLDRSLQELSLQQLESLLEVVGKWNTNTKTAGLANLLMHKV